MVFSVVPAGLESFTAASEGVSAAISAAGSADSAAMVSAAAAAVGPIGATYLAAYAPAQASNLASTMLLSGVHAAIGGATEASKASFIATDSV
jgi:hypothetical protein